MGTSVWVPRCHRCGSGIRSRLVLPCRTKANLMNRMAELEGAEMCRGFLTEPLQLDVVKGSYIPVGFGGPFRPFTVSLFRSVQRNSGSGLKPVCASPAHQFYLPTPSYTCPMTRESTVCLATASLAPRLRPQCRMEQSAGST